MIGPIPRLLAILLFLTLPLNARAGDIICGGVDDTATIRTAFANAPTGGVVSFGATNCVLKSRITINRPMTITGTGYGSQIFGTATDVMFSIEDAGAVLMRDLYLGMDSTLPEPTIILLTRSHNTEFRNITLLGGDYGVRLLGSTSNLFVNLRSGTNIGGFFKPTPPNKMAWVQTQRVPATYPPPYLASNDNMFIAPELAGGHAGIIAIDQIWPGCSKPTDPPCIRGGEGSIHIRGGALQSMDVGIQLFSLFHPSTVIGTHFEKNWNDITIGDTVGVFIHAIGSLDPETAQDVKDGVRGITIADSHQGSFVRNIEISGSKVQRIELPPNAANILLRDLIIEDSLTEGKKLLRDYVAELRDTLVHVEAVQALIAKARASAMTSKLTGRRKCMV